MTDNTGQRDESLIPFAKDAHFYIGTVTGTSGGYFLSVKIDGLDEAIRCHRPYNASYSNNSRIIIIGIGGTYLVLGRVS